MTERWGEVGPPYWDDAPVYLVGGGPSIAGFDLSRLVGLGHVVGVNHAMFDAPAEAGVSIDPSFIAGNAERLALFACSRPLYLVVGHGAAAPRVPLAVNLRSDDGAGLSLDPRTARRGGSSGYAALQVAVLKRARKILLVGYDYGALGGRHHYHDHYPDLHPAYNQCWGEWARRYEAAAADCRRLGVEVINVSARSALTYFPRVELDSVCR